MKTTQLLVKTLLIITLVGIPLATRADDPKPDKPRPYPLKTCLVCGMKLAQMDKPYTFVYKGQEIKVCDKSEKEDFDKDPAKYLKKLKTTEAERKSSSR